MPQLRRLCQYFSADLLMKWWPLSCPSRQCCYSERSYLHLFWQVGIVSMISLPNYYRISPIRKLYLFFTRTESVEDCSYFDPVGILRDVPFLSGGVSPVPGAGLLHRTWGWHHSVQQKGRYTYNPKVMCTFHYKHSYNITEMPYSIIFTHDH